MRADLRDLEALDCLSSSGCPGGLQIQLHRPVLPPAPVAPAATADLIARFCATYNAHKPQRWLRGISSRGF